MEQVPDTETRPDGVESVRVLEERLRIAEQANMRYRAQSVVDARSMEGLRMDFFNLQMQMVDREARIVKERAEIINNLKKTLQTTQERLKSSNALSGKRSKYITQLEAQLKEAAALKEDYEKMRLQLSQDAERIATLEKKLRNSAEIHRLSVKRSNYITELEEEMARLKAEGAQVRALSEKRSKYIARLEAEKAQLESAVADMRDSVSWKVTRPLRAIHAGKRKGSE